MMEKSKDNQTDNIISGVHNYCDRWCERCRFIKRCTVGLAELERMSEDKSDIEIWDEIATNLTNTIKLISEKAAELGIDLTNLDDIEIVKKSPNEIEKLAMDYGTAAHHWMNNIREKIDELTQKVIEQELAIPDFKEAFDVINWFEFFIGVKTRRAFQGYQSENEFEKNDSDGSAKIALIAIDKSIEAYLVLYYQFPEYEDDILGLLKQLSKLKKHLLTAFPDAISFIRPGFDE